MRDTPFKPATIQDMITRFGVYQRRIMCVRCGEEVEEDGMNKHLKLHIKKPRKKRSDAK